MVRRSKNSARLWMLACVVVLCAAWPNANAQQMLYGDRLPLSLLDAAPPSAWVAGRPGEMTLREPTCRTFPEQQVRRRIVNLTVQEWAFFGFRIFDQTIEHDGDETPEGLVPDIPTPGYEFPRGRRRFPWRLPANESARVASTIAGYWAATPEGSSMLARQNRLWREPDGIAQRWLDPWSAAFVSWVMCEAGLGTAGRFQRGIAHRAYIDQAIRARDGTDSQAAYVAYDLGERPIVPGDLLCSGLRPVYRTLAERRQHLGQGARTHCDIVVQVDEPSQRIAVIGGNVRRAVTLKLLPAVREPGKYSRPLLGEEARPVFAHLRLRAPAIEADALNSTPTLRAIACNSGPLPARVATLLSAPAVRC